MSKTILILWSVLSFIVSGLFIFYGLMIFQLEQIPTIAFYSAIVALCYGLFTIFVLSQSWINPNTRPPTITKYIVVMMFVIQMLLNFDVGIISGLEWVGLIVVALMLSINWLSVKYVSEYKKA